jgi:TonB family protein
MKIPRLLSIAGLLALGFTSATTHAADAAAEKVKHGYTVTVEIKANEKGEVESVALVKSEDVSGGEVLSKMALAMAMKMKVPPQMKDGKPVRVTMRAPFFFPIEDDEGEIADQVPKPKVKEAIQPAYPPDLREKGIVGGAILELVVGADGKLTRVTTLRASHPEFEAAAMDSIKKWVFTPAQSNGQPVESRTRFAFTFETEQKMADLAWRIPPRPRLGALVIIRPDHPIEDEPAPGTQAPGTPAPSGAPATPPAAPATSPAK